MTRFAKVRIVCRTPEPTVHGHTEERRYPIINGVLASATDVRAYVVTNDGVEHEILVDSIEWKVRCDGEPATATIRIMPDRVDVEALAAITWEALK